MFVMNLSDPKIEFLSAQSKILNLTIFRSQKIMLVSCFTSMIFCDLKTIGQFLTIPVRLVFITLKANHKVCLHKHLFIS